MKRKILGAAAALVLTALPLGAQEGLELLKKQTVQIKVEREDGSKEEGSGVILCQLQGTAYVITADHVFYGQSHDGRKFDYSRTLTTEVRFYSDSNNNRIPAIVAEPDKGKNTVNVLQRSQDKDLLLFTVETASELKWANPTNPPADSELRDRLFRKLYGVVALGSPDWVPAWGEIKDVNGPYLLHSAKVEKGYSGGPLFNESGGLVGINIRYDPNSSTGSSDRTSRAVTLKEVQEIFNLPSGCVESLQMDDLEDQAHEKYRDAIRYIHLRQWEEATPLLVEAAKLWNNEGGRLHLQGMRYTEYLPHFQLGLAQYWQGNYVEAYKELSTSFDQHVIKKGHKRYNKLVRLKKIAFQLRNGGPKVRRHASLLRRSGQR